MTSKEITDYIMSRVGNRTGVESIGHMIEGLVDILAWQQENMSFLEKRIIELESKNV